MVRIEQIAEAALSGETMRLRSLVQDFVREISSISDVPRPSIADRDLLAASASLIELLAQRSNQDPPLWTQSVGPLEKPVFLLKSATAMKRLRQLCQEESPGPLRKRGFYAPANYLEMA